MSVKSNKRSIVSSISALSSSFPFLVRSILSFILFNSFLCSLSLNSLFSTLASFLFISLAVASPLKTFCLNNSSSANLLLFLLIKVFCLSSFALTAISSSIFICNNLAASSSILDCAALAIASFIIVFLCMSFIFAAPSVLFFTSFIVKPASFKFLIYSGNSLFNCFTASECSLSDFVESSSVLIYNSNLPVVLPILSLISSKVSFSLLPNPVMSFMNFNMSGPNAINN